MWMNSSKQEIPLGDTLFIEWVRKQELAVLEEELGFSIIKRTNFNRKFDAEHYSVEYKRYTIDSFIDDLESQACFGPPSLSWFACMLCHP